MEKETPESKNRSEFERLRLISYVERAMRKFIKPTCETKPLFNELVFNIVDERLHLKTYGTNTLFLRDNDLLDSLNIVLEGHVVQTQKDGTTNIIKADEIIGESHLPQVGLCVHTKLKLNQLNLQSTLRAAPRPCQRTDILSIYFEEITILYQRIIDRENRRQLAVISKINWFNQLDPIKL